ncbi:MAG TPA: triose-phosphate isomerase [Deltaproteobacteria bacterium]|nr:triose-phosphate isomerase [Deltaproteobacteria bacterium]
MRRALIAGNWKMYKTLADVDAFAAAFAGAVEGVTGRAVVICPPFIYLERLAQAFKGTAIKVGAQNVYWEDQGAFTGEVSAPMLKSLGITFVIVGHSERRQYFGDTDTTVNKRVLAALKSALIPIVCVGETLEQREAGHTMSVIDTQVRLGLKGLSQEQAAGVIIAYEPVWAIGTGRTATPEIAQEVHAHIRGIIADLFGESIANNTPILYGGSVKPDNIDELMAKPDVDGALVGGASLEAASFERIVKFKG